MSLGLLLLAVMPREAAAQTVHQCERAFAAWHLDQSEPKAKACEAMCKGVEARAADRKKCEQAVVAAENRRAPAVPREAAATKRTAASRSGHELSNVRAAPRPIWVSIPGGEFQMGSTKGESNEKPVRRVRIKPFELAMTEVTVRQYRACVEAKAFTAPDASSNYCNWGNADRDEHPVNCVDWEQAKKYSEWVGGRLPTEAEWEYAARSGGREQEYPWGDEPASCKRAIQDDGGNGCGQSRTWPVCSKPAGDSAQGICDLAGNVWEWTDDWYGDYAEAPTEGSAQTKAAEDRVIRGGGWDYLASFLRAARRYGYHPGYRDSYLGFRSAKFAQP